MSLKKGRPTVKDGEKKTSSLHARCTQAERSHVQKLAFEEDLHMSEYVLDAVKIRERLKKLADTYSGGNIDAFLSLAEKWFTKTFGE